MMRMHFNTNLMVMMHSIQKCILLVFVTNFLHPIIAYKYSVYNAGYSGEAGYSGDPEPEISLGSGYELDIKTWRNVASLKHGATCQASSEYNHNFKCHLVRSLSYHSKGLTINYLRG